MASLRSSIPEQVWDIPNTGQRSVEKVIPWGAPVGDAFATIDAAGNITFHQDGLYLVHSTASLYFGWAGAGPTTDTYGEIGMMIQGGPGGLQAAESHVVRLPSPAYQGYDRPDFLDASAAIPITAGEQVTVELWLALPAYNSLPTITQWGLSVGFHPLFPGQPGARLDIALLSPEVPPAPGTVTPGDQRSGLRAGPKTIAGRTTAVDQT